MKALIQKVLVGFNDVTLENTVLVLNGTGDADYFLLYKLFKGQPVNLNVGDGTIMIIGQSLKVRKQVVKSYKEITKERELFEEFLKEREA